jgi:hypothetical protein
MVYNMVFASLIYFMGRFAPPLVSYDDVDGGSSSGCALLDVAGGSRHAESLARASSSIWYRNLTYFAMRVNLVRRSMVIVGMPLRASFLSVLFFL